MATLTPPSPADAVTAPPSAAEPQKIDYQNLPCPIPYEEIQREALRSLNPELFEGMRFDYIKALNRKYFSLSHSAMMGPTEVSSQSSKITKIPTAHYEFGANFIDPKLILSGRVMTDGKVNASLNCNLTDNLTLKGITQSRLRGKIDSNGVVAAYLEEQFDVALKFILSAEVSNK